MESYAKIAYEAYFRSCGGKAVNGDSLPPWEDLHHEIRDHWEAAADAVIARYVGE